MGWNALGKHSLIIKNKLPLSLNTIIYDQCIRPVTTYADEPLRSTNQVESKLTLGQRAMERSMLGIILMDKKLFT